MKRKIEQIIINSCLRIAKKGKGALIVFGGEPRYKLLVRQVKKNLVNIQRSRKKFENLAIRDGALILCEDGLIKNYGAMIEPNKVLKGYGTRHAGGVSASLSGATVFLVSEEEKKVKVFERGRLVMQIDSLQKGVEKNIPEAIKILESVGAGTIGVVSAGVLIPTLAISLIPGILFFSGSYYFLNKLKESLWKK